MEKSCLLCHIRAAFYSALRYFFLIISWQFLGNCQSLTIEFAGCTCLPNSTDVSENVPPKNYYCTLCFCKKKNQIMIFHSKYYIHYLSLLSLPYIFLVIALFHFLPRSYSLLDSGPLNSSFFLFYPLVSSLPSCLFPPLPLSYPLVLTLPLSPSLFFSMQKATQTAHSSYSS